MQYPESSPIYNVDAIGSSQGTNAQALLDNQRNLVEQTNEYLKVYQMWEKYNEVYRAFSRISQEQVIICNTSNS
jgi:hypothetical protein